MRLLIQLVIALAAIAQVSAEQRSETILIQGNAAGTQTVQTDKAGVTRVEYSYNDRGRGDHIAATWKLDPAGVPTEYEAHGNDYMKAPVEERFQIKDGAATWKNRSEQGKQAITGEAFYVPANPPPEFFGVLARALLKAAGHRLPLLPAGEASIEESGKLKVGKIELIQYRITRPWLHATGDLARSQRKYGGECVELVLSHPSSISKSDSAVAGSATSR